MPIPANPKLYEEVKYANTIYSKPSAYKSGFIVNQTTNNWIINAPTNIIISSGNTLNAGSGGANNTSTPSSFTQRYTITNIGGTYYYVGCST